METNEVTVERLTEYSEEDAAGIGRLMPFLSQRVSGAPMSAEILKAIIDSPHHDQFVARLDEVIVGTATASIVMGAAAGKEGFLSAFVTDPEVRGKGVGDKVWNEVISWCRERNADLTFTSKPERGAAHRFYLKHGAVVAETTVFKVSLKDSDKK